MQYLVNNKAYHFSYSHLQEKYHYFISLNDEEFLEYISSALHFAVFVCYLKEIPSYECLSDEGIIHQLVHLLHIPNEPLINLQEIREQFKKELML